MKTIFRFIIAAMSAISVFSSCQKELANETASSTTDGVRIISVQFDNSTKASLSGLAPTFTNNDKIRVSNDTKSEVCTVSVDGSGNTTFTTTLSGALTAIYPADAAVLSSDVADAPIATSNDFKVSATQDGTMEKAIIAKATVAEGESTATFYGLTSLFVVTPPSGVTSFTIASLKQIGTDGQRSGTAVVINTEGVDAAAKCKITVNVPTGGTAYVSLVSGVNLTDLSFDAGETYGMKGIPMKDITAANKNNATAANTIYTIGNANNTWHPYVVIDGKKWATMNIGASSATDAGTYFSWGAVEKVYSALSSNTFTFLTDNPDSERYTGTWSAGSGFAGCNAPFYNGSSYGKYTKGTKGKSGGKTVLDLADDAANFNWGGSWRMPIKSEFDALSSLRQGTFDSGYHFGGDAAEAQIFLPVAGQCNGTDLYNFGEYGCYWSSSLRTDYPDRAWIFFSFDGNAYTDVSHRFNGQSVRALSE